MTEKTEVPAVSFCEIAGTSVFSVWSVLFYRQDEICRLPAEFGRV